MDDHSDVLVFGTFATTALWLRSEALFSETWEASHVQTMGYTEHWYPWFHFIVFPTLKIPNGVDTKPLLSPFKLILWAIIWLGSPKDPNGTEPILRGPQSYKMTKMLFGHSRDELLSLAGGIMSKKRISEQKTKLQQAEGLIPTKWATMFLSKMELMY